MSRRLTLSLTLVMLCLLLIPLASCSTTVKYLCPQLAPPPPKVVDSLETAGRQDPSSAVWVTGLEKHYEKLDTCKP